MNNRVVRWFWYAFDMGNSAHAIMISTVGFALYFKQYLISANPNADFIWGLLTAATLAISAVLSPVISSYTQSKNLNGLGLFVITVICVVATALLALTDQSNVPVAIFIYLVSATGYYVALPIYNSYLPVLAKEDLQGTSGRGWGLGYMGGIGIVAICFAFGLLDHPVEERPDLYRVIFVVSACYNLLLSLPIMIVGLKLDKTLQMPLERWEFQKVINYLVHQGNTLRLLVAYWLVGEVATVVLYFTAIYLSQYEGMDTKTIFLLTLALQFAAFGFTWFVGNATKMFSQERVFKVICLVWIVVPVSLFSISYGLSYWVPLFLISTVIGSYHSVVRGRIAQVSEGFESSLEKGSVWGFLEVSGRISQVLGPLLVGICTLYFPLGTALLAAIVFPVFALLVIRKYTWA